VELIVISRIYKTGYSRVTLCHIYSRKYFPPYLHNILCYKIYVALWWQKHIRHFIETKSH